MTTKYYYHANCVGWPENDVHAKGGLCDMINECRDISRRTFLKHVDREELAEIEDALSYARHPSQGLTMAADWAVGYFRSMLHGKRVYGFQHSRIEYVFVAE